VRKSILIGVPLFLIVIAVVFFVTNPFKIDFSRGKSAVSTLTEDSSRGFTFQEGEISNKEISTESKYEQYELSLVDDVYLSNKLKEYGLWNEAGINIYNFNGVDLGKQQIDSVSFILSDETVLPYPFEVGGGKYRIFLSPNSQFLNIEMYIDPNLLSTLPESEISKKISEIALSAAFHITHPDTMTSGSQSVVVPDRSFLNFKRP